MHTLKVIGTIETCFTEKFGVPRQSMMVKQARGIIRLSSEFSSETVLHLNGFSHLWVLYLFHKNQNENHPNAWSDTIQPPRIDAPKKVGVFASRSPHRPNPIGMSVVKLERVGIDSSGSVEIEVSGVDILNGSPLIDIKPYIPYADSIEEANSGWITNEISRYSVIFDLKADLTLFDSVMKDLIVGILEWDPRPRSQREHSPIDSLASVGKRFAFRLKDLDIHWVIDPNQVIRVVEVRKN